MNTRGAARLSGQTGPAAGPPRAICDETLKTHLSDNRYNRYILLPPYIIAGRFRFSKTVLACLAYVRSRRKLAEFR